MFDSVCGLQNQLNIIYETANRLGLVVNLVKSKCCLEMVVTLHVMKNGFIVSLFYLFIGQRAVWPHTPSYVGQCGVGRVHSVIR